MAVLSNLFNAGVDRLNGTCPSGAGWRVWMVSTTCLVLRVALDGCCAGFFLNPGSPAVTCFYFVA